jgi:hypothetical protein
VQQPLSAWQNFFVIVGTSAGALIGLQFVVVALVANMPDTRSFARTASVFATPTIVHFGAVLILAGIFNAPWRSISAPMALVALGGAVGFAYCTVVARRAHRVEDYKAVMEDWIFHVLLPASAYLTMTIAAAESLKHAEAAVFAVAGSVLALLVVGIHNAWDSVVYIVTMRIPPEHGRNRDRHR